MLRSLLGEEKEEALEALMSQGPESESMSDEEIRTRTRTDPHHSSTTSSVLECLSTGCPMIGSAAIGCAIGYYSPGCEPEIGGLIGTLAGGILTAMTRCTQTYFFNRRQERAERVMQEVMQVGGGMNEAPLQIIKDYLRNS
jgi:hypothetical protein